MPSGETTSAQVNASLVYVPASNRNINITVYVMSDSDETTAQTIQELVDVLQTWSGRDPLDNAQGTIYATTTTPVLPADAVIPPPTPDPEPDPNG